MARRAERLRENVPGEVYVDSSCIDCDLCRQIAPATFGRHDGLGQSVVRRQPADERARQRALMALVTCPTHSIGTAQKIDSRAAARAWPEAVAPGIDDVLFTGWASEDSYGAAAWLVRRADGNVLVDSPRASRILMDRGVERIVDGEAAIALADDLTIIPVPGHTAGSCALRFRETFLFSGDHVWASDDERGLAAGRDVCWYSWPEQRRSMARLAEHAFTWVLPGHGRRWRAPDAAAMRVELRRLAAAM